MCVCQLCKQEIQSFRLLPHIRLSHPELDATVETWPDGLPVIYEETEPMEEL
jgi:hypothetical protein